MSQSTDPFHHFNQWLRDSVTFKLFAIGVLILALMIPTAMIMGLVSEREYTSQNAVSELSSKWGEMQTITGPILTVPYRAYVKDEKGKIIETIEYAHFLPDDLKISGGVQPETRYRGIFEVVVYNTKLTFAGVFSHPNLQDWNLPVESVLWENAFVAVGIPDMRGIQQLVELQWNDSTLVFNPGIETREVLNAGVSVATPLLADNAGQYTFSFELNLNGSRELNFTPLGRETLARLTSNWPDPSFSGAFLPDQRTVSPDGFEAEWRVLHLNRNYPQQWRGSQPELSGSVFGVTLLVPVDHYQKTMRSAKYAIMFLVLTFMTFFFVEVLNKRRIHPFQYILVGLALVIFYLLLLSFAEHIPFNYAYGIGSFAVIGLITAYSRSIFRQTRLTLLTAGVLTLLYSLMFVILQLQDYALLMGSIGLFVVLAIVMYVSRNIDWYGTAE